MPPTPSHARTITRSTSPAASVSRSRAMVSASAAYTLSLASGVLDENMRSGIRPPAAVAVVAAVLDRAPHEVELDPARMVDHVEDVARAADGLLALAAHAPSAGLVPVALDHAVAPHPGEPHSEVARAQAQNVGER